MTTVQFLNNEQVQALIDIVVKNEILPTLPKELFEEQNKEKLELLVDSLSVDLSAPLLLTNAVDTYENLYNYTKGLIDINKYL